MNTKGNFILLIFTAAASAFSTTTHHRSNKIIGPLSSLEIRSSSKKTSLPASLVHRNVVSPFHRTNDSLKNSSSLTLSMSKIPFSPISPKRLHKTDLPPTIQSNISICIQWIIFALFIVGISLGFHIASLHQWLGIGSSTWKTVEMTYPSLIALSCIFNLAEYTIMQGLGGGGEAIAKMMGGTIIDEDSPSSLSYHDSGKLKKALLEVYEASGLPMQDDKGISLLPHLYLIPAEEPNAFAAGGIFGRKGQVVALTTGLLDRLNMAEVRAVIAHEVGHLRNRDTIKALQLACMIAALGSTINISIRMFGRKEISNDSSDDDEDKSGDGSLYVAVILFATGLISYSIVNLLRLASSRSVEYDADAFAKAIGAGDDLVSALKKISNSNDVKYKRDSQEGLGIASGAFAHSYIDNPPSRESPIINLFGLLRTHPTTIQRVARLQQSDVENESLD